MNDGVAHLRSRSTRRGPGGATRSATSTGSPTRPTRRWPGPARRPPTGEPLSIALVGNAAEIEPAWAKAGERFDVVTDQTSAHDALGGYVPAGDRPWPTRSSCGGPSRTSTSTGRCASMADHVRAMLAFQARRRGRLRLRQQPPGAGPGGRRRERLRLPGLRAGSSSGRCSARAAGPFRWVALSRRPGRHPAGPTRAILRALPRRRRAAPLDRDGPGEGPVPGPAGADLLAGLRRAGEGRPRVQRAGRGRARCSAPIVIGRDHLDSGLGRVTQPRDGGDARRVRRGRRLAAPQRAGEHRRRRDLGQRSTTAAASGSATASTPGWSSSPTARTSPPRSWSGSSRRDPGMGVIRHADAGYERAIEVARERGVRIPMRDGGVAG